MKTNKAKTQHKKLQNGVLRMKETRHSHPHQMIYVYIECCRRPGRFNVCVECFS